MNEYVLYSSSLQRRGKNPSATDCTNYNKGLADNLICHYQHMQTTVVSIGSCIPEKHYNIIRSLNIAVQKFEIIEWCVWKLSPSDLLRRRGYADTSRTRHGHPRRYAPPGYKGLVRCVFNTIKSRRKDIRAKKALEVFSWKGEIPVTCTVLQNEVLSVPTFPDVLSTKRSGYQIRDSHVASRYALFMDPVYPFAREGTCNGRNTHTLD